MKTIIKSFFCGSHEAAPIGLKEFSLNNLPPLFALAGPNGAGKTRFLRLMRDLVNDENRNIEMFNKIEEFELYVKALEEKLGNSSISHDEKLKIESQFTEASNQLQERKEIEPHKSRVIYEGNRNANLVYLSSNSIAPALVRSATLAEIRQSVGNRSLEHFAGVGKNAYRIIQEITLDHFNATHQQSQMTKSEKDEAVAKYENLNEVLFGFFGERVVINSERMASINGMALEDASFSEGQKKILQYISAIIDSQNSDRERIVVFDEIENHLHPKACIDLINLLSKKLHNIQMIISTHDVSILSFIGKDNIWCMSEGKAYFAGKKSQEVLLGLCGGEDNVSKIADFVVEPEKAAVTSFLVECLSPPLVAQMRPNDPQGAQVASVLDDVSKKHKAPLRLLDWGAGKGRLAAELAANNEESQSNITIEYHAYDPSETDKDMCLDAISLLNGSQNSRWFGNTEELKRNKIWGNFDVVVMSNVLHEIDPQEWSSTFSLIQEALSEDGHLFVVEDLLIPHGEIANRHGFVLLDPPAFCSLLGVSQDDISINFPPDDSKYAKRLVAYVVEKEGLANVSPVTVKDALQTTLHSSKRRILEIRERSGPASYDLGHKHALAMALYANASLALESI